jgi:hypothetical protein
MRNKRLCWWPLLLAAGLTATFAVFKLVGLIRWSWWTITTPLWGPFAIALVFVAVALLGAIIAMYLDEFIIARRLEAHRRRTHRFFKQTKRG